MSGVCILNPIGVPAIGVGVAVSLRAGVRIGTYPDRKQNCSLITVIGFYHCYTYKYTCFLIFTECWGWNEDQNNYYVEIPEFPRFILED